jgi:hypothetical protein
MIFFTNYRYFIFIGCLFSSILHGSNIRPDFIDKNDLEKLENFFLHIIHRSSIGYCLCGEKPLATESFINLKKIPSKHAHRLPKIIFEHYGYSILWNGWKCWERYAHLFPSQNFVLRFIEKFDTLVLINKSACKRVIEDNIDLFHKYLKTQETPEEILNKICHPKDKEEYIFKHTALLGILYGYGRNNSIAFANRSYIQKLEPCTRNEFISPILGYGFIIINNGTNEEENKLVINVFERAKENIQKKFKLSNNFETFLELYTR